MSVHWLTAWESFPALAFSHLASPVTLLVPLCLRQSERSWECDQGVQVTPGLCQGGAPWDAAVTHPSLTWGGRRGVGKGMRIAVHALQGYLSWFPPSMSFGRGGQGAAFLPHPH